MNAFTTRAILSAYYVIAFFTLAIKGSRFAFFMYCYYLFALDINMLAWMYVCKQNIYRPQFLGNR